MGRQLALLPEVAEEGEQEIEWARKLGPTETLVRKRTLPSRHALAEAPAAGNIRLAANTVELGRRRTRIARGFDSDGFDRIDLDDLPQSDFESWEAKWARELKFMDVQRRRHEADDALAAAVAASPAASSIGRRRRSPSACSAAGSVVSFTYASSCASTRAPSPARSAMSAAREERRHPPSGRHCVADACGAWAVHDAACAELEARLARRERPLRAADVPWPPRRDVCGFHPEDGPAERKRKLRRALLRWHPDKWHGALEVSPEKAKLAARLAEVTQQILRERALS